MGVDLRILPQYSQNADFSHDIIDLHRDSDMFELISELENKTGREVPRKGINTFSGQDDKFKETCYGKTTTTPYGYLMKGVLAKELKSVLTERRLAKKNCMLSQSVVDTMKRQIESAKKQRTNILNRHQALEDEIKTRAKT
jgi:hypothetical protein